MVGERRESPRGEGNLQRGGASKQHGTSGQETPRSEQNELGVTARGCSGRWSSAPCCRARLRRSDASSALLLRGAGVHNFVVLGTFNNQETREAPLRAR